ncbi:MAG: hypothetical protein AB1772_08330 [Candidatus Zixiibacteriota bacterium]
MRSHALLVAGLTLALWSPAGAATEIKVDSNTAFYKGETLSYVVYPPDQCRMVEQEATADGYSFGFIPEAQAYEDADLLIGVNIFKIRGLKFSEVLRQDTVALRDHYGPRVAIWPIDSVRAATGQLLPTFFINDTTRFIPNVMIAYVDGRTEMLVFELVISDRMTRIKAEDAFVQCLRRLKIMPIGELGRK